MFYLYNILLALVTIVTLPLLVGLLASKAKLRSGLRERLGFLPDEVKYRPGNARPVWLHAVSVGEVTASVPILRALRRRHPDLPIVLSTITSTGQQTARQKVAEADHIIYFPFDYYPIVRRAIRTVNPRLFIHTETEIWPNFLWGLKRRDIPSVIVNGRLSERSMRGYRRFGFFFRRVLEAIVIFGMQSERDGERAVAIGARPDRVRITGNMKFDQAEPELEEGEREALRAALKIPLDGRTLIAGSTHPGEETAVVEAFKRLRASWPDLRLLIAPRHPERFDEVTRMADAAGLSTARKTELDAGGSGEPEVVVIDTIGELARLYGIGDIIFVGGTLAPVGGHNVLEPIAYGKPVLFGPHVQNIPDIAAALIEAGGAVQVDDADALFRAASKFLDDPAALEEAGRRAYSILEPNQGATERNLAVVEQFLS